MDNNVSLTISKDIVNPIVEAKIKEAIIAAMGGSQEIIEKVVQQILTQKVDAMGKVSSSSYDKLSWLDFMVTKKIEEAVKVEIAELITQSASNIKDALIKNLQSKKGSNLVAKALLDGLLSTFTQSWNSKLSVEINQKTV